MVGTRAKGASRGSVFKQNEKLPPMLSYEGLNKINLAKVIDCLDQIDSDEFDVQGLNEQLPYILRLQDGKIREGNVTHIVQGTALHYVVSKKPIETLRELLKIDGLDVHAKASYILPKFKEKIGEVQVQMEAVHLAAYQGKLDQLEALLSYERSFLGDIESSDLLNLHSTILIDLQNKKQHFTPLHFAILGGSDGCDKVIEWLIENGADPQQADHEGTTPLHLLAFIGFPPDRFIADDRVEELVKMMQEYDALRAESRCKFFTSNKNKNVTPLELAIHPGSQFPTSLIHLLSPALSWAREKSEDSEHDRQQVPDFFEEILLVVSNTQQGAIHYAKAAENDAACGQLWLDALRPTTIRALAILMFRCPEAATKVLNILSNDMCEPDQMDIYTHALPTLMDFEETTFFGRVVAWEFRCAYNRDTIDDYYQPLNPKPNIRIPWPQWKSSADWHESFAPSKTKGKGVPKDCKVKVSIVPNLIHLDMFWALTMFRMTKFM